MEIGFVLATIVCCSIFVCRILKKRQYIPVSGMCIDVVKYEKELIPRKKCCYQYTHKGFDYKYWERGFYYHIPTMKKGEICELYICKRDSSKCITPSYNAVNRDLFILAILLMISAFVF